MSSVKAVKAATHHFLKEVKNKKAKGLVEKDASQYVTANSRPASKSQQQKAQLFATVDAGRLHVGLGENYVGSIDSYNNFVTKFVANLFGWSTKITIDGKTRHVNKTDYFKWLNDNTANAPLTKSGLGDYTDLHLLEIKILEGQGRMRDHLSAHKTRRLFEKMVLALVGNKDFESAKRYAGKGANVDDYFWVREGQPISLSTLTAELADDKAYDFRAGHYTPLLYAAEKNDKVFCEFLRKLQANPFAQGEYVQFTKRIMEVNPVTTIFKSEEFTSSDGRLLTRVTLKTSTQLQIEDQVTPKVDILFDPETNAISKVESRQPIVVEKYSKNIERYTTRYL